MSLRRALERRLLEVWYGDRPVPWVLAALEALYRGIVALRRAAYRSGLRRAERVPVPVVVVGNLTAGGTGKTPLTIALCAELAARGWRPGVVSRGYGGRVREPVLVRADDDPARVGDEALLIARTAHVPVAVARRRATGARRLMDAGCDLVVADDGLQHWSLARDVEIAVIDGRRGLGNGRLLPAGPLREPAERLARVDFIVRNDGEPAEGEVPMRLEPSEALTLIGGRRVPLASLKGEAVHAVAGIGNPGRFFAMLERAGLAVEGHAWPDHHAFRGPELEFPDRRWVLVTEKDAIKCAPYAHERVLVVPVEARLPAGFFDALHRALHRGKVGA